MPYKQQPESITAHPWRPCSTCICSQECSFGLHPGLAQLYCCWQTHQDTDTTRTYCLAFIAVRIAGLKLLMSPTLPLSADISCKLKEVVYTAAVRDSSCHQTLKIRPALLLPAHSSHNLIAFAHDVLCICSQGSGTGRWDEPSFDALVKHLQRDGSTSADELKVWKPSLVRCFIERKAHQFRLQLRGSLLQRSIKTFKVDWAKRKQVGFHTCFRLCKPIGLVFKAIKQ